MRRRSTKKTSAADLLVSPEPTAAASPHESPAKVFEFNFSGFNTPPESEKKIDTTSLNKKISAKSAVTSKSAPTVLTGIPPTSQTTLSDLKELASSCVQSIKRHLDCSHSEIFKDMEASHSRLHKRLKIQSQAIQQMMDEAEQECKKLTDRINIRSEALKASFTELMSGAKGNNASRALAERSEFYEKAINGLRSRYGVTSA